MRLWAEIIPLEGVDPVSEERLESLADILRSYKLEVTIGY